MNANGVRLATTALLITICSACSSDLFNTRTWTFQGVSTASKPSEPYVKLRGEAQYSLVKVIKNPNGWRADVTWSAPRDPSKLLSIEDEDNLPYKFDGAYFHFMKPAEDQKENFPWSTILEQAQAANGPSTGRVDATGSSELVYWGRVSISQDNKFNCATDCLVLFHWGTESDAYTVHLSSRMPPQAKQDPIP